MVLKMRLITILRKLEPLVAQPLFNGAIRDPLSEDHYVYQVMRITGSADPRVPIEETIQGKLPQRKITTGAAEGYSSYGNQIGVATGQVAEIYHPVMWLNEWSLVQLLQQHQGKMLFARSPCRESGDTVGGRTGRDGCVELQALLKLMMRTLFSCGSEVQREPSHRTQYSKAVP